MHVMCTRFCKTVENKFNVDGVYVSLCGKRQKNHNGMVYFKKQFGIVDLNWDRGSTLFEYDV